MVNLNKFIFFYTIIYQKVDESPTFALTSQLVYICGTYLTPPQLNPRQLNFPRYK